MTVTFAPQVVGPSLPGTLTIHGNDPVHPNTVVSFCGEGLPNGIRVIVLQANGVPYPVVDQITITGGPAHTNVNSNPVPLFNLGPPASCEPVRYHLQSGLLPTNTVGQNGSNYELKVRVGNKTKKLTFTLGNCEYKLITVSLP